MSPVTQAHPPIDVPAGWTQVEAGGTFATHSGPLFARWHEEVARGDAMEVERDEWRGLYDSARRRAEEAEAERDALIAERDDLRQVAQTAIDALGALVRAGFGPTP